MNAWQFFPFCLFSFLLNNNRPAPACPLPRPTHRHSHVQNSLLYTSRIALPHVREEPLSFKGHAVGLRRIREISLHGGLRETSFVSVSVRACAKWGLVKLDSAGFSFGLSFAVPCCSGLVAAFQNLSLTAWLIASLRSAQVSLVMWLRTDGHDVCGD